MKIGFKLALVFTVMIVVIIGSIAILSIQRETATLKKELEMDCLILTNILAEESVGAFLTNDFTPVMGYTDTLTEQEYVLYAMVRNNEGIIKAHSNVSKIGTTLIDPTLNAMSDEPIVKISQSENGEDMMDFAVPVIIEGKRVGVSQIGYSLTPLNVLTANAINQIIIISIVSVIFEVLLAFLLAMSLTKPIVKLHQGTEEIMKGNLDYKVGIKSGDEIGQLAMAFERMTADLKESIKVREDYSKSLESTNEQLKQEITERTQAEDELRKAHDELEMRVDERTVELMKINEQLQQNLTERKQAEKELRESKEWLKSVMNAIQSGIVMTDAETHEIMDANRVALDMIGVSKESVLGSVSHQYISPAEMEKGPDDEQNADNTEYVLLTADGKKVPIRKTVVPIYLNGQKHLIESFIDITEYKKAEKELQMNAEYLNVVNQEIIAAKETLMVLNQELEQKVKERTAKIEKLLAQKDEFIGQLGHDLKTPLTPLVALLPLMQKREKDPELQKMLEVSIHNVNYMKDLVIKTLQFARVTSPDVELIIEDINLLQEVNNAIERQKFLFAKHDITVENKINDKIIVKADKLRLEELFSNLITNAVKYTPEDRGTITFDAKKENDFVTISVRDTGIGMSKKQLKHVFEAFYKADKSRHELESSGLGLSICKRIVEKHGGNIWAESPGKGMGTTFYFTFKSD